MFISLEFSIPHNFHSEPKLILDTGIDSKVPIVLLENEKKNKN